MAQRKRVKNNPSARQYFAAKFNGSNGDLIVGQVKSVRSNGDVILTNLLTGNRSTKATKILLQRNHKVTKKESLEILALYNSIKDKTKARAKARAKAVELWENKKDPSAPNKDKERKVLVQRIDKLSKELAAAVADLARL